MPFDLAQWKTQLAQNLRDWKPRMTRAGVKSAYAFISAAALYPVAQAAQQGDWAALAALGGVTAGVGTNLLANQIQKWRDEKDAAAQLETETQTNAELRRELDAVLEKLDAFAIAQNALPASERAWFRQTLRAELARLGNANTFAQTIIGDSNVAVQGNNNAVNVMGENATQIRQEGGFTMSGGTVNVHGDLVSGNKTQEDARASERDIALRRYLSALRRACSALPLAAMGGDETPDEEITLDRVYIDLDTTTHIPLTEQELAERKEKSFSIREQDGETKPLSALAAAASASRLVLLGDPGSGKSTFVKRLVDQLATAYPNQSALPEGFENGLMPLLIFLRDLAPRLNALTLDNVSEEQRRRALAQTVREQLRVQAVENDTPDAADALLDALETGNCLLVLDGMDEVPYGLRALVRRTVGAVLQTYHPRRVIVTCRVRSYNGEAVLPNFITHTIAPFDDDRVQAFAKAWYNAQKALGRLNETQADAKAQDLAHAALAHALRELSSNPMLLTTMAIIHQRDIGLPSERVRLYHLAVDVLLRRWQKEKSALLADFLQDDKRLRKTMERLAYHAQRAGRGEQETADLSRGDALTILEANEFLGSAGRAEEFLDYVDQRAGLLVGRGGEAGHPAVYGFPHRTFQEYLAGCYMAVHRDATRLYLEHAAEGEYWNLAAELGAEDLYYNRGVPNNVLDLAYRLSSSAEPRTTALRRATLWSGKMTVLLGRATVDQDTVPDGGTAFLERLVPRLVNLLASDLSPAERADAGDVLARLGDPRRQVTTLIQMEFCFVRPGAFQMGSDKAHDSLASDEEQPLHTVTLPAFWLGRFPVTQAQFTLFVQAGGYSHAAYWSEAEQAGFWRDGKFKGRYDNEARTSPKSFGEPFDFMNHPVVGVSWYEALAFCRWLDNAFGHSLPSGYHFALPSEAEWEKAARGGLEIVSFPFDKIESGFSLREKMEAVTNPLPARVYPWGDTFDLNHANTSETGIQTTSAVGCFPRGASVYGVQELSGNVWEWTRSVYQKYPNDATDGRETLKVSDSESRVVRGGSFVLTDWVARCAYRFRYYPYFRYWNYGFRVVASPSASGLW